jgi:Nif-specific regulatory protein
MPYLIVHQPDRVPSSVEIEDGATIGRHEQCGVPLVDAKASRRHAQLSFAQDEWTITDLGSTHGTFVNGERVTRRRIEDGDRIQIGQVLLVFSTSDDAPEVLHTRETLEVGPAAGAAAKLRVFYQVAAAIGAIGDADALLGHMLEAILEILDCERGVVGVCETGGLRRVARTRNGADGEIVVSRQLVDAIVGRKQSVIVREPERNPTLVRERILSAMGVPLLAGGRILGLLYVDDRGAADRFSEEDLAFLAALGHLTASTLEGAERYRRAAAQGDADSAEAAIAALVGESDAMARLRSEIQRCAATGAHVLVQGESGTGKELAARALHALSPRANGPFVALNCAAIPETMLESELFGYVKGAFTGAVKDKRGKFILAHQGTLFLDEIGDLAPAAQAKVLRAIQEGEVQPLGAEQPERVDVRILAATHKDLSAEVRAERFREDLYYRLAVVELDVPPLRDRGDDVILLAQRFLSAAAGRLGKGVVGFDAEVLAALRAHAWPGNVRELENVVERAAIFTDGAWVDLAALSARVRAATTVRSPAVAEDGAPTLAERFAKLEPMEKALVEEGLAAAQGNLSEAARLLGITRIMMRRRVERFGLSSRGE